MSKKEKTNKKIYGVYLAYHKCEILPDEECKNTNIPNYPREIARVRICDNRQMQLDTYANTHCPASQLIEADNEKEFAEKVSEMKQNFENEEWLEKNIYPYV